MVAFLIYFHICLLFWARQQCSAKFLILQHLSWLPCHYQGGKRRGISCRDSRDLGFKHKTGTQVLLPLSKRATRRYSSQVRGRECQLSGRREWEIKRVSEWVSEWVADLTGIFWGLWTILILAEQLGDRTGRTGKHVELGSEGWEGGGRQ